MVQSETILYVLAAGAGLALGLSLIQQLRTSVVRTIVGQTQRGLIYRHGRFEREVGPGRHTLMFGRTMTIVEMAEVMLTVSNQEIMSSDRLPVRCSALVRSKIIDARKAIETTQGGYYQVLYAAAQLALRDVASELPLEDLIDRRTKLDDVLAERARPIFAEQGFELIQMSLRDVVLPPEVRRLATDVVRARMEAASSLERARGEQATLRSLANAARLLKGNPELMNLRVLQALASLPGKNPPTLILNGGAGIVPVPRSEDNTSDTADKSD